VARSAALCSEIGRSGARASVTLEPAGAALLDAALSDECVEVVVLPSPRRMGRINMTVATPASRSAANDKNKLGRLRHLHPSFCEREHRWCPLLAIASIGIQPGSQPRERLVESLSYGAGWNAERLGDRCRRAAFDEARDDGRAIRLVELDDEIDEKFVQSDLCHQLVGRCRCLCVVRERVARSTPSMASVLHASKIANHLGEPRPHRPSGVWLASPRGDPRLLHEVVRVVSIAREPRREAFQPSDVLEHRLRVRHFGHDPILPPALQTLPRIASTAISARAATRNPSLRCFTLVARRLGSSSGGPDQHLCAPRRELGLQVERLTHFSDPVPSIAAHYSMWR
jgi:hypothetical protein